MAFVPNTAGALSVAEVADSGAPLPAGILALDQLSDHERQIANRFALVTGAPVAIHGVMRGLAAWDLRPIISRGSDIWILRFADPDLLGDEAKRTLFSSINLEISQLPICGEHRDGEDTKRPWIARPFYRRTLADFIRQSRTDGLDPVLAAQILAGLLRMIETGRIHGHVCPQNMAITASGFPALLDAGFWLTASKREPDLKFVAPECRTGITATVASEIYSLGRMLLELFPQLLSNAERSFAEKMLAEKPDERPSDTEIRQVFATFLAHARGASRPVAALGAGRLISSYSKPIAVSAPLKTPALENIESNLNYRWGTTRSYISVIIILLVALTFFKFISGSNEEPITPGQELPFVEYWDSGREQLMRQVATAALVEENDAAAKAIFVGVLKSNGAKGVRSELIRAACRPEWCKQLSAEDRRAVLHLALSGLVPEIKNVLPNLDTLHPAVLLSMASGVTLGSKVPFLAAVDLSKLAQLPGPIGLAFLELSRDGVSSLAEQAALGLAHIAAGDSSAEAILAYALTPPSGISLNRLRALEPLNIAADISSALLKVRTDPVSINLAWFASDEASAWADVTPEIKLKLSLGQSPEEPLSMEQYADLLRFPINSIRQASRTVLENNFTKNVPSAFLDYFAKADSPLSRVQIIALVLALDSTGELRYALCSAWFKTAPDPRAVVDLLALSSSTQNFEAFSLEAARFLANHSWEANLNQLSQIANHKEALARALAYSKLDPSIPAEREVLRKRVGLEPVERLKSELKQRMLENE